MADATVIDYKLLAAIVAAVCTPFITVIGILWRRIDVSNQKCIDDRDKQNQERIAENKEWNQKSAAENKAWFDRVEALHKERATEGEKMFGQVVRLVEKSKDAEYATINAISDTGRAITSVKEALTLLTEKVDDLCQETKVSHGRPS